MKQFGSHIEMPGVIIARGWAWHNAGASCWNRWTHVSFEIEEMETDCFLMCCIWCEGFGTTHG